MMDDLLTWFRAALDEDERLARAAGAGEWHVEPPSQGRYAVADADDHCVVYDEGCPTEDQAAHIAEHNPARVLREVEAKRRIIDECEATLAAATEYPDLYTEDAGPPLARVTLRLLALPYADRAGYREEWRP